MKVGVITFHNCLNYGAIFQTYALTRTISRYHDCDIINYHNDNISIDSFLKKIKEKGNIKDFLRYLLYYRYYRKKNKVISGFLRNSSKISSKEYYRYNIKEANEVYDCFVSGSDQVFNLNLTNNDYTYYLDFVSDTKKKIAYAASFGWFKMSSNDVTGIELLKRFDKISLRESLLIDSVEQYTKKKVTCVLDPTFLLTKNEWVELAKPIDIKGKYILLYLISPKKHNFKFAKELSKKTKLPVYYINYSYKIKSGVKNIRYVSPEQFIYLLKNAEYVVTNSFHGTALSINLNKEFFCELSKEVKNANSRITEIIDKLDLQDRIIESNDKDINLNKKINYDLVNDKLNKLREKSYEFLDNIKRDKND